MSELTTHLAAIGVGVVIALLFVGGFNNNKQQQTETAATKTNGAASSSSSSSKKKNKKKNKKKAAAKPAAAAPVAAAKAAPPAPAPKPAPKPAPAPAPAVEEPPTAPATNGGKKKKNKKKKNGAATNGAAAAAPKPAPAPEPAPAPAPPPAPAPAPVVPAVKPLQPRVVVEEEWETIPKKSKKKKNSAQKKQQEAAAAAEAAASAAETKVSVTVTIDAARVGIIIGPKGATMNAIQEKTGTKLDVNAPKPEEKAAATNQFRPVVGGRSKSTAKATVVISEGTTEGQKAARKAILELADRGYAALLQAEGFGESSISVHPRFLSEIVGTGGKIIKAIQSELDVKLTIPKTDWTPKTMQVRPPDALRVCVCV